MNAMKNSLVYLCCGLALLLTTPSFCEAVDHHYYSSTISEVQIQQSEAVAKRIADSVLANSSYRTDSDKIRAAMAYVISYGMKGKYGNDENKYYRSPYGVFISGNFTCAGLVRALGRVLDYMGYEWQHINENQWKHQWIEMDIDGKHGYVDPSVWPNGNMGLGKYETGESMASGDSERKLFEIFIPVDPTEYTGQLSEVIVGSKAYIWGTVNTCVIDKPDLVSIKSYFDVKDNVEKVEVGFVSPGDVTLTTKYFKDGKERILHSPFRIYAKDDTRYSAEKKFREYIFNSMNFYREKVYKVNVFRESDDLDTMAEKCIMRKRDGEDIILDKSYAKIFFDDISKKHITKILNEQYRDIISNPQYSSIGIGRYADKDTRKIMMCIILK